MTSAAVDLGGTRIKLGLIEGSSLKYFKIIPASPENGLKNLLPEIKGQISKAVETLKLDIKGLSGIGISFPGLVNSNENRILSAPAEKYSDAASLDLKKWALKSFALPIVVENDANMALLGEWKYGAGKGCDNLVMVTLGTGIGTSVIINGEPLRGVHFQAGCLGGHFTLNANGDKCICGNNGCIEMQASKGALLKMLKDEKEITHSSLFSEKQTDFKTLFEHAKQKDTLANKILKNILKVWGITLVNLIHAYDPEKIIISGGIIGADYPIVQHLQEFVNKHAWTPWGEVKIVKALNPDSAALFGAHFKLNELSIKRSL
ncbi:MAG: ROK family protein [Clostridiales bacterium]